MAGDAKGNLFSFFGGGKRIPKSSYESYLKAALLIDVVFCWMPLAGTVFIGYCRGMWWLNGYKTDKMLATTLVNAATEALPGLSFFPSCSVFVWLSYRINKAGTDPLEGEGEDSKIERAQNVAFRAFRRKAGRDAKSTEAEPPESAPEGPPGKKADEGRSPSVENSRKGPSLQDTPKQEAPKENKAVDGIAPRAQSGVEKDKGYQPRQPVFRQQPANDNQPAENASEGELPEQGEQGEEYFDNARRVA